MSHAPKVCPVCGTHYDGAAVFCQKDGGQLVTPGAADPFIGKTLLGQFRIDAPIGSGGMGTVYRAHQASLGRNVAVKILHPELAKNPDAVRRFHREAKVATSLEHPNLVRVFLFGELPEQDGLYLVMEYLDGRSLTDVLRTEGVLNVPRALHIATQICSAVGVAHSQGIVHRDVKPENVMVVSKHGDPDFVKVLDFGIARMLWAEQSAMTQSGVIFGTARYISPEGASGEATDARSDVYSIGVLIYQLLSGTTPFDATSPVAMLMKHIHDRAPDIRSRGAGAAVPPPIADAVMRSLAKNADARFSNAADFGLALQAAAAQCGIHLARTSGFGLQHTPSGLHPSPSGPLPPVTPTPTTAPVTYAPAPVAPEQPHTSGMQVAGLPKRPPWMVMGLAFVLGAIAVVGAAWGYQTMQKQELAEELAGLESRAREALEAGHYNAPPGDNVADLTQRLLERDPDGESARAIRREAVLRLREAAALALAEGHQEEALSRYQLVLLFEPDDELASAALEDIRTEMARPPREPAGIRFTPSTPQVGEQVSLGALLDEGVDPPERGRFEIYRGTRRIRVLSAVRDEGSEWFVASYVFRRTGEHRVRFEADDEALEATVDIERGRREVASDDDEAPVTTQHRVPVVPSPTPEPTEASDDGIDWSLPPSMTPTRQPAPQEQGGEPPAPWTGNVI